MTDATTTADPRESGAEKPETMEEAFAEWIEGQKLDRLVQGLCRDAWDSGCAWTNLAIIERVVEPLETRLSECEAARVRAFEAAKIAEEKVRAAAKALYQIRDFGSSKIEYDPIRRIAQQWFDYHGGNAVKALASRPQPAKDGT